MRECEWDTTGDGDSDDNGDGDGDGDDDRGGDVARGARERELSLAARASDHCRVSCSHVDGISRRTI